MKFNYSTYTLDYDTVMSEGLLYLEAECKELDLNLTLPLKDGVYDELLEIFKKKVDNHLNQRLDEDAEVLVVERFIQELDMIHNEMQLLKSHPHYNIILNTKLSRRVFEIYKQWIPIPSLDYLREYYLFQYMSPNKE